MNATTWSTIPCRQPLNFLKGMDATTWSITCPCRRKAFSSLRRHGVSLPCRRNEVSREIGVRRHGTSVDHVAAMTFQCREMNETTWLEITMSPQPSLCEDASCDDMVTLDHVDAGTCSRQIPHNSMRRHSKHACHVAATCQQGHFLHLNSIFAFLSQNYRFSDVLNICRIWD